MGEVKMLRGGSTKNGRALLHELADNEELESVIVIGFYKPGSVAVSWSSGLRNMDFVYGERCLHLDIDELIMKKS